MKKILAPTDFSDAARNAVEYAAQLALKADALLVLFNVYEIITPVESTVVTAMIEEARNESIELLQKIQKELLAKYGSDLKVEYDNCYSMSAVDAINDYALENDIDLMVMGMQGCGYISERVMGSVTTSLMQNLPCSLLVIGEKVKFKDVRRMVLACDYLKIPSSASLDWLKGFAEIFHSPWVYVLHVLGTNSTREKLLESLAVPRIHNMLKDVSHSIHSVDDKDIMEGINHYADKNNADMVAMIPRRHSIWRGIFYLPLTKRMAFRTSMPLLILQQ